MTEQTQGTMTRSSKGRMAPPPMLDGVARQVADVVGSWPGVVASAHWHLFDRSRMDGVDFYVGEDELGHIHLDGSIHLATNPTLGKSLMTEGLARRFPYAEGWVQESIRKIGCDAALELFRRNYQRFATPETFRSICGD